MRLENGEITIRIPIPIEKPDANGVIYSMEAVENAIQEFNAGPSVPLITDIDYAKCIGVIHNAELSEDKKILTIKGNILAAGTCDAVTQDATQIITEFHIQSFGIGE